jgi:hypothetical protein
MTRVLLSQCVAIDTARLSLTSIPSKNYDCELPFLAQHCIEKGYHRESTEYKL